KASLLAVVNERSKGSLKAVQSYGIAFSSLFEEGLFVFSFHPPNIFRKKELSTASHSHSPAKEGELY
ncbi:MAG: hypothetical protein IKC85_07230, partial [Bacteroidaceae bacterium]|nr:hypothetical protein [Bacteroidaceae bacterium]